MVPSRIGGSDDVNEVRLGAIVSLCVQFGLGVRTDIAFSMELVMYMHSMAIIV